MTREEENPQIPVSGDTIRCCGHIAFKNTSRTFWWLIGGIKHGVCLECLEIGQLCDKLQSSDLKITTIAAIAPFVAVFHGHIQDPILS